MDPARASLPDTSPPSRGTHVARYPQAFIEFRSQSRLDDAVPPLSRLAYYLAGIAHLSEEIGAAHESVVCDRYFASPLAFLLADGVIARDDLDEMAAPVLDRILIPDLTVLLAADHETLARRLENRGETRAGASMRRTLASAEFTSSWLFHLRRIIAARGAVVEIDTTELDTRQVCRRAEDALPAGTIAG
jgi:thymidylate kinase